jgi:hypothetical protein
MTKRRVRHIVLLVLTAGCASHRSTPASMAWTQADAVFHQDRRWLGGDGAYSIDLGADRTLWLFGDSFIATSDAGVRTESTMVHNTIAVMQGRDPTVATMQFAWADGPNGFFGTRPDDRYPWPADGVRIPNGPLLVFLALQKSTPGQGLGFTEAGYAIALISNPDDPPAQWSKQVITPDVPSWDATVKVGNAVVIDGDFIVSLTSGNGSTHTGWLVRWLTVDARRGDFSHPQWWNGDAGWVAQGSLAQAPLAVLANAAPECSVHFDAARNRWVQIFSSGFGATTIAARTASALTGPWSDPTDLFTPPESMGPHPFVYAGKAHPELTPGLPGALVVTYATNSLSFADLLTPEGSSHLYWPRMVNVILP